MARLTVASAIVLCAAPALAAGGGGADGSKLLSPNPGTIIWTVITFLLMVFILGRYAWKPLTAALDEREQSIQGAIADAKNDRAEAEKLLAEQRTLLEETRRERAEALAAGQRDAETLKAEILEEARQQREQLLQKAEAQVAAGMSQARTELRGLAAGLAVQAAEKLLTKNLDDPTQRKLVEDYLADLERSGGAGSLPS
ncbi:MAG: F0F1 ATP synthase subunit B [bacterium]|nr:F0F1 ATP synthase subunit B [bacterium]